MEKTENQMEQEPNNKRFIEQDFDKFKKSVYLTGGNNVDDDGEH